MVVTLEEASPVSFSYTFRNSPRKIIYRNVEYFLGSELGAYCGLSHGSLYAIPEIMLSRRELTRLMRAELRIEVILIFWPTKQKIVMCIFWVRQSKQFLDPPPPSSINFEHNQQ